MDNAAGALQTGITVWAVKTNVTPAQVASTSGTLYVAQSVEPVQRSDTGVMTQDSRFSYQWNRFGRLVAVTSANSSPNVRLTFDYYADGRRARKQVWQVQGASTNLMRTHQFHYDSWNLISESVVRGPSSVVYSYTWGLDLAGQRSGKLGQDAGGIGGLLAITQTSNGVSKTYFPMPDHVGSIMGLVDAQTGQIVAEYSYDPYGAVIGESGSAVGVCPFLFQSKYYDSETGLYYFGARYYDPATTKWLSRDPLGEFDGGVNLSQFCGNDPVNRVDPLGLRAYGSDFAGSIQEPYDWIEENYTQEEVDRVYAVLAERDRHIYNTGLANRAEMREKNRLLLERIVGVPVDVIWNPTFGELGTQVGKAGRAIGRHGLTCNPVKIGGNVVGGVMEMAGAPIAVAGYGLDWVVAPFEKVPLIRTLEPTYRLTMRAYRKALREVLAGEDRNARVWAWMHSEGAIHGLAVFGNLSEEERYHISGYTFGGGAGAIPHGVDIRRLGLRSDKAWRRWLLIDKDAVAAVAGGGLLRDYSWMDVDENYVHGFDVYLRTWVPIKARVYFEDNARQILGR